jgi:hypothetical protein
MPCGHEARIALPIHPLPPGCGLADLVQLEPRRGDGVSAGPEMLAREVSLSATQPGYRESRSSLSETR